MTAAEAKALTAQAKEALKCQELRRQEDARARLEQDRMAFKQVWPDKAADAIRRASAAGESRSLEINLYDDLDWKKAHVKQWAHTAGFEVTFSREYFCEGSLDSDTGYRSSGSWSTNVRLFWEK